MTTDELRTKAVEALGMLASTTDLDEREEYLAALLLVTYQSGYMDAQERMIEIGQRKLAALTPTNNP